MPSRPVTLALQRYASTKDVNPYDNIDEKSEAKVARSEIEPEPELVSTDSSVRHVFGEEGVEEQEKDTDMLAGVKQDMVHPRSQRLELR